MLFPYRTEGEQQQAATPLLDQPENPSAGASPSSSTATATDLIDKNMTVASKELTPLKASQDEFVDARPIEEGIISSIYNFVKKAALVGCVYFVGYMGWSVAWLIGPVILSVVKDQWRKDSERRRNDAKVIAQSDEKRVILARLNELPSWVRIFMCFLIFRIFATVLLT